MNASTPTSPSPAPQAPPSPFREFWHAFRENKGAVGGLGLFILLLLMAVFATVVCPHDPDQQFREHLLMPPGWSQGGDWHFLLGTDAVGRDILSRLIVGSRFSLMVGFVVVSLSLTGGVILGLLAGFLGGWTDTIIMRIMDVLLTFPGVVLALGLVALFGPGLTNAMFALALVYQPYFVRLTRGAVLAEIGKDYVVSARLAGASPLRLMIVTILPNCLSPLIVQTALLFSQAILDAAALGFLGMGAQPPTPEWGTMLAESREFILRAWWVVTFPGLAILITVLATNLMGDGLRDALDPKLRRS